MKVGQITQHFNRFAKFFLNEIEPVPVLVSISWQFCYLAAKKYPLTGVHVFSLCFRGCKQDGADRIGQQIGGMVGQFTDKNVEGAILSAQIRGIADLRVTFSGQC